MAATAAASVASMAADPDGDAVAKGNLAIRRALRSLRQRRLLEEAAHRPAIDALSRPFAAEALNWRERFEQKDEEMKQFLMAQSRLTDQLVEQIEECKKFKALAEEHEESVKTLQSEILQLREENSNLKESLSAKTKSLELLIDENRSLREQMETALAKQKAAEAENRSLIDRWMQEKMNDAEKLNEANAMYEEMVLKLKAAGIGGILQHAKNEGDGVVRQFEAGYQDYVETPAPSTCVRTIRAHDGGCNSILFHHNSGKLISGCEDRAVSGRQNKAVKIWDSQTGALCSELSISSGSVLDLAVTNDNKFIIAACSSNNLYVFDAATGQTPHILTNHDKKVCSVDTNRVLSRIAASAAHDRTIKIWDLNKGISSLTILTASLANSLAFVDSYSIYSGHTDGKLRMWDTRREREPTCQVDVHSHITSVCVSRNGTYVLTTGKDNVHNLFDIRTLEICGTYRARGNRVVSSWGRPCISPDDAYIAAGASDGSLYIWSRTREGKETILEGHSSPVLSCAWSDLGEPLASADRSGNIYIWS